MRVAIIDLGTNTFNLLIADIQDSEFQIVHKEKRAVKLGKKGINNQKIAPDAFKRGLDAMVYYSEVITDYSPEKIMASATSAMRDSENAPLFISQVLDKTGIQIEVISGKKEAELIHQGVKRVVPTHFSNYVIMDVGGGSTEFILVKDHKFYWAKSYNLGVSRLLDWLEPQDPISSLDEEKLLKRLNTELAEVYQLCEEHQIETLIGSSGSFDSAHDMILARTKEGKPSQEQIFNEISTNEMAMINEGLRRSTLEERLEWPGLVTMRADMMVISSLLMNHIIMKCGMKKLFRSEYALKEGLLFSLSEETE